MKYFNYRCQECHTGTVRDVVKKNHKITCEGVEFVVPKAIVGVCDHCGAINYAGEELHRWQDLFKAWQVKSDKYISPSQIKQIRTKLGLNQSQFAEFLGVSRQGLAAWENEKRAQVQPLNVDIILRILLSEIDQPDRSFTAKMLTAYRQRCQTAPIVQLEAIDKDALLQKILPQTTYEVLHKKASENNTTPLTELIRLAETCYYIDQTSQTVMEFIQNQFPYEGTEPHNASVNTMKADYPISIPKGVNL